MVMKELATTPGTKQSLKAMSCPPPITLAVLTLSNLSTNFSNLYTVVESSIAIPLSETVHATHNPVCLFVFASHSTVLVVHQM